MVTPYPQYSPQVRAERLIAVSRAVLAGFSLFAIYLDPSEPAIYANLTYALLASYLVYAVMVALLTWSYPEGVVRLRFATHVFDIATFSVFMYFTEGPTSPFFVYFTFSVICGTLRWQWRGTIWTAVAALAAFVSMGVYSAEVLRDPKFELNSFIMRGVYLGVLTALLGYLAEYERKLRSEISGLAGWPTQVSRDLDTLLGELLGYSGEVLGAPRVLMAWEEPEEPWLNLALWSGGKLQQARESPAVFEPLVPVPLTGLAYLCRDARAAKPVVFYASSDTAKRLEGTALHSDLQSRFSIGPVLSVPLRGENLEGRLFFLDSQKFTSDDLLVADILARQIGTCMELYYVMHKLQLASVAGERIRLARDLHDGLLQSLTGAALQLEMAHRLLADGNAKDVRERLLDVQRLLIEEHRSLRFFIQGMKPISLSRHLVASSLKDRLDELRKRLGRQWGLDVELKLPKSLDEWIPRDLGL